MAWFLVGLTGLTDLERAMAASGDGSGDASARYSDMFYLAPTGYLIIDSQGRVSQSNATAAAMLGVDWQTLLSSSLESFVTPECRGLFDGHFQAVRREICKQTVELKLARPDGAVMTVRLESSCALDRQGNQAGFRVAMINLSPRPSLSASAGQPKRS